MTLVGAPSRAMAQTAPVRWDAGGAVGVVERFMRGADPGAPRPLPGPSAELFAHVALLPMVRVGAYAAYDASPATGRPPREIVEGGLRVKLTPPLLGPNWRSWVFVGLGYAAAFQPGYTTAGTAGPDARTPGTTGGLLDLPFGVGIGARVWPPWTLFAELSGRAALVTTGAAYDRAQCLCRSAFLGKDSVAAGLSVGVSWGQ